MNTKRVVDRLAYRYSFERSLSSNYVFQLVHG
jgi:hypothetical protein